MRRLIVVPLIVILAVLAIVGGIGYWIFNSYTYYGTDDAQVSAPLVTISSPQAGQLTNYALKLGDTVDAGQTLATITTTAANGTKVEQSLSSPISGTVIQSSGIEGQSVTPGQSLLEVADLHNLKVTAYVDESAISNVKVNQDVDIKIDAFGGTSYTGHVERIVQATAGTFSLLPSTDNASANFTKVGQRIPVIVTLDGSGSNDIVPGMSASVTIHLH